jgi:hypothetical protein
MTILLNRLLDVLAAFAGLGATFALAGAFAQAAI